MTLIPDMDRCTLVSDSACLIVGGMPEDIIFECLIDTIKVSDSTTVYAQKVKKVDVVMLSDIALFYVQALENMSIEVNKIYPTKHIADLFKEHT